MNALTLRETTIRAGLLVACAASLAACAPHHGHHGLHASRPMTVPDRLDCPDEQGRLKRVFAAADGSTCEYHRDDGEVVTLTRVPLVGQSPQDALAPIEASLKAMIPPRPGHTPSPPDSSHSNDKDSARIDVPGVHIDAHGDKAEVKVFGVTIDADNDKADVHAGLGSDKAVVSADESGAEVHASDIDATNANVVLVLASAKPGPTGLHAAGYIARGPVTGPLVVAEFKSLDQHTSGNDDHDIHKLLDLNVGR